MKCAECNKPALRIGSKNRGYCGDHKEKAFAQMKIEGVKNAMLREAYSDEIRRLYAEERMIRAI